MSAGYVTTHVLDTANGRPAAGVRIEVARLKASAREALGTLTTNADGRTDQPAIPRGALTTGRYELVFDVAGYYDALGTPTPFLQDVVIRFAIADAEQHYHVPLLVAPFGYTTYRGS